MSNKVVDTVYKRGDKTVTMDNYSIQQLDDIVKKTIDALEKGKTQIYTIAEGARQEWIELENRFAEIQEKVKYTIEEVETLTRLEKESRYRLMIVSKNFKQYGEEDIKQAYDTTRNLQIKLALAREKERQLIAQRTEIEMRMRKVRDTVERAEYLATHVAVAMNYLSGSLSNISDTLEELQQKELLGMRIITAQEEERQRLARDIHDGPAQSMSNIILKCEICEKIMDLDVNNAKKQIGELKDLIKLSLQEIRRIIFDLRPMSLDDLGLVPTLQRYAANFTEETGIDVVLDLYDPNKKLNTLVEIAVFRIIQEALNNIKKHSKATRVYINLQIKDGMLFGKVIDNGIGFNVLKFKNIKKRDIHSGGFGIYSMQQRAELLNGKLKIHSQPGKGTTLLLQIPIEPIKEGE
ncbi:MAG: sensor histidine kinase [Clostridiales bacterium]|jgi:two-component system sensor histidine kinase DegS|nr:sensor histidine kinase [Clostridiales bacterium]